MYCVIASERETACERRNGSWRMLLIYMVSKRIQYVKSFAASCLGVLTTPLSLEAGLRKTSFVDEKFNPTGQRDDV
jgi:hypothetical protein